MKFITSVSKRSFPMERVSDQSLNRMRKSFYNIFAYFLEEEKNNTQVMECLVKWGVELGIHKMELQRIIAMPGLLSFTKPEKTSDALEQIYDLLYMINMDGIVEDIELSVINIYTKKIGLEPYVVNNVLKALVSASIDGVDDSDLRNDIKLHPEVYV